MRDVRALRGGLALAAAFGTLVAGTRAGDAPTPPANPWKGIAAGYRMTLESTPPVPLTLREEPALKWTNPQRRTDDGAVFVWLDRGRPEVAASFYRYKADGQSIDDHEFVSLATSPISATRGGEAAWSAEVGGVKLMPIPDAPRPAATLAERLRQMKALARDFRATFNNPPDLSEIRLLTQPLYRFETEGRRTDVLDGALFAFVHTTDPEVLLMIEARAGAGGGPIVWHYAIARMSMVRMRVHHKEREVWSVEWDSDLKNPRKPYMVRSYPLGR